MDADVYSSSVCVSSSLLALLIYTYDRSVTVCYHNECSLKAYIVTMSACCIDIGLYNIYTVVKVVT